MVALLFGIREELSSRGRRTYKAARLKKVIGDRDFDRAAILCKLRNKLRFHRVFFFEEKDE